MKVNSLITAFDKEEKASLVAQHYMRLSRDQIYTVLLLFFSLGNTAGHFYRAVTIKPRFFLT